MGGRGWDSAGRGLMPRNHDSPPSRPGPCTNERRATELHAPHAPATLDAARCPHPRVVPAAQPSLCVPRVRVPPKRRPPTSTMTLSPGSVRTMSAAPRAASVAPCTAGRPSRGGARARGVIMGSLAGRRRARARACEHPQQVRPKHGCTAQQERCTLHPPAMPTSAFFSAGASLTPSPVMPTMWLRCCGRDERGARRLWQAGKGSWAKVSRQKAAACRHTSAPSWGGD